LNTKCVRLDSRANLLICSSRCLPPRVRGQAGAGLETRTPFHAEDATFSNNTLSPKVSNEGQNVTR
jgi:hypothetical protein